MGAQNFFIMTRQFEKIWFFNLFVTVKKYRIRRSSLTFFSTLLPNQYYHDEESSLVVLAVDVYGGGLLRLLQLLGCFLFVFLWNVHYSNIPCLVAVLV